MKGSPLVEVPDLWQAGLCLPELNDVLVVGVCQRLGVLDQLWGAGCNRKGEGSLASCTALIPIIPQATEQVFLSFVPQLLDIASTRLQSRRIALRERSREDMHVKTPVQFQASGSSVRANEFPCLLGAW